VSHHVRLKRVALKDTHAHNKPTTPPRFLPTSFILDLQLTTIMMDVDYDTNPRVDWEAASAGKISNNVRALCATCKQVLGDYSRFKNCTTCREKARTKRHLSAQRKQERQVWAIEALAGLSDEEGDGSGAEENHATRPGGAPPVKKKPKFFSELDGKERDVALLEMKNGLKRKFGKQMVAPPSKVILSQIASHIVIKENCSQLKAVGRSIKPPPHCTIL